MNLKFFVTFIGIIMLSQSGIAKEIPMLFQSTFPQGEDSKITGYGQMMVGYGGTTMRPVGGSGLEMKLSSGIRIGSHIGLTAFYTSMSMEKHPNYEAGGEVSYTVLKPRGWIPGVSFGISGLRDHTATGVLGGRVSLQFHPGKGYIQVTSYFEKAFAAHRDDVDIIMSTAAGVDITNTLRAFVGICCPGS